MLGRVRGAGVWLLLLGVVGCGAGAREAEPITWHGTLDTDHPLVGRIVDREGRSIGERELIGRLAEAATVVLGEQHDNADHHALQASIVDRLVGRGRRPALVFEQIELAQQAAVDAQRQAEPSDVDGLGRALSWQQSGWPPWPLYRPLFAVALEHGLPILAGSLDRADVRRVSQQGLAALPPELVERHGLAQPLPPDEQRALEQEMQDAHCGMLPEGMLGAMVLVQRARDATLAQRALQAGSGAVVIAGNGHARGDRGVPAYVARAGGGSTLALALLEVRPGLREPAQYARSYGADRLPFDFAWFTPRDNDRDHCEELRKRFAHPDPGQRGGE